VLANPDVSDPIYVHGFDIPIDRLDVSEGVEQRLAAALAQQGRRLRVVRTNVRELLDRSGDWMIAHGPAMAAVGLLLATTCGRVLIPSTDTYAMSGARGSHPLLDHLWSTESCRIEHYGAHLTRTEKIEHVAEHPRALEVLRAFWRHVDGYNCGACEKCLRTMVALEVLGELERCPAFTAPLDLEAVSSLRFVDPELPTFWKENLALARRHDAPSELRRAIETCIANAEAPVPDEAESARSQLDEILSSLSWRLTRPLRRLGASLRR